jgi:hypothetical protein
MMARSARISAEFARQRMHVNKMRRDEFAVRHTGARTHARGA